MNKQELIGHVADRAGLSRNDASRAIETMLEVITSTLKRGDEVRLVGFGNFSVTRRKASTGRNPRTDEPMQYADFAEWQNELLQSPDEHAEQGRNFWNELKRGLSPLSLPLEKRKTADQTFHPEAVSIDFDPSLVSRVDALARACETSTQVVLFTCWQAIVSRLTNQSHFVIFNLFDGRKLEDLKSAFGGYAK